MKERVMISGTLLFFAALFYALTLPDVFPAVVHIIKWIFWGISIVFGVLGLGTLITGRNNKKLP